MRRGGERRASLSVARNGARRTARSGGETPLAVVHRLADPLDVDLLVLLRAPSRDRRAAAEGTPLSTVSRKTRKPRS
jgi:hypothetical protein